MKATQWILIAVCGIGLILAGGCSSTPIAKQFSRIQVAQSSSTEVLNDLPEQGMMHSADAVSVYHKEGWTQEVGIVKFNDKDSIVQRKDYVQVSGQMIIPLFTRQKLYLFIATTVPDNILNDLYETDLDKQIAILRYCHQSMIEDARQFNQDNKTISLIGMARSGLGYGIQQLSTRPREAYRLSDKNGFDYIHPVMGESRLYLNNDNDSVYILEMTASDVVDVVGTW